MPSTDTATKEAMHRLVIRELGIHAEVELKNFAQSHLKKAGYILTKRWSWLKQRQHSPTNDELLCIKYLIEEWDFGCLITAEAEARN